MMVKKVSRGIPQLAVLTSPWKEYELLDSGNGLKLERFGAVSIDPPGGGGNLASGLAGVKMEECECHIRDQ